MTELQTFLLPDAGGDVRLTATIPVERYIVRTEPGAWMLVVFGSTKKMSAQVTSGAIRCVEKEFEFKHYCPDGSKYWTTRPGYQYLFAVRKADLRLLNRETYSFPVLVLPGGEQVRTNTSGGSLPGAACGWCDWLLNVVYSCVDHPVAAWQALNAVAVKSGSPFDTWLTREERAAKFFAENNGRWMAIVASRSELHAGMTEVTCTVNADHALAVPRRTFLVPSEQYACGDLPWLLPEPWSVAELVAS